MPHACGGTHIPSSGEIGANVAVTMLSARRVGPTGFAYGLDMTEATRALARANAGKAVIKAVAFV